jgi:hypothetical protein
MRAIPAFVISALALGAEVPVSSPVRVGVIVRNLCAAEGAAVREAEGRCTAPLRAAGVEISWINTIEDVTWHEPDVVLRAAIVSRPKERRACVLGVALPFRADGIQIFVAYDNIVLLSWRAGLPVSCVMAAALMHEIGHVLLGSAEHASAGIMRAEWDRQELNQIGWGLLGFAPEERKRMQSYALSLAKLSRPTSPAIGSIASSPDHKRCR